MGQSKVSMVVPCYNKREYIGDMLRSVYGQIWDSVELILVNDGSTDGTRKVISEWEPKLRERFEVTIIDQENQGVAAAVKNGLLRITGDYVCVVDCDDELYPDYVSAMAEFLGSRLEYEWCMCNFDVRFAESGAIEKSKWHGMLGWIPIETVTLEDFMYNRFARMVWRYMIRTSYLKKCAIAENMQVWNRNNHEIQFGIPLLAGGGAHGYVKKHLYLYNYEIPGITQKESFQKRVDFENGLYKLIEGELERLDIADRERRRLLAIADLHRAAYLLRLAAETPAWNPHIEESARDAADTLNRHCKMTRAFKPVTAEFLMKDDWGIWLFWRLEEVMFNKDREEAEMLRNLKNKRRIGYGALGKVAGSRVPQLISLSFPPQELWDKAAKQGDELCGIPVTRPDFDRLSENDILMVFLKKDSAVSEFKDTIRKKGTSCKIFYYEDMEKVWPELSLPIIYDGDKLIH